MVFFHPAAGADFFSSKHFSTRGRRERLSHVFKFYLFLWRCNYLLVVSLMSGSFRQCQCPSSVQLQGLQIFANKGVGLIYPQSLPLWRYPLSLSVAYLKLFYSFLLWKKFLNIQKKKKVERIVHGTPLLRTELCTAPNPKFEALTPILQCGYIWRWDL